MGEMDQVHVAHTNHTQPGTQVLDCVHGPLSAFGITEVPRLTTEEFPWTDEGNARAVKRLFGTHFRYIDAWGWLTFTGTHWTRENAEHRLKQAVVRTLRLREVQAQEVCERRADMLLGVLSTVRTN